MAKVLDCYLPTALFELLTGMFARPDQLGVGTYVLGAAGDRVRVAAIVRHPEQERELVQLTTRDAIQIVTADHPVMVPRGKSSQPQAVPAESLKRGHRVYCSGFNEHPLTEVKHFSVCTVVYQITFEPNVPVESFNVPLERILTKGHCSPRARRPLHNRSRAAFRADADAESIPVTPRDQPAALPIRLSCFFPQNP